MGYTCERSHGTACFLISLLQGTFPVHQSLLGVEILGKATSIEMKCDWWKSLHINDPLPKCSRSNIWDLNPKSWNTGPWSPLDQTSSLRHSLDLTKTKSFNFWRPWMALAMLLSMYVLTRCDLAKRRSDWERITTSQQSSHEQGNGVVTEQVQWVGDQNANKLADRIVLEQILGIFLHFKQLDTAANNDVASWRYGKCTLLLSTVHT